MKQNIILLSLVSLFFISCSPGSKLKGRYVSVLNDTFIIGKTGTIICKGEDDNQLIVKQRGHILKFKTTWYQNRLFNRPHKLYFKISGNSSDRIVLLPITRWAVLAFKDRDSIILRKDTSYKPINL